MNEIMEFMADVKNGRDKPKYNSVRWLQRRLTESVAIINDQNTQVKTLEFFNKSQQARIETLEEFAEEIKQHRGLSVNVTIVKMAEEALKE